MKKNIFLSFFLVLGLSLGFSGCKKSKNSSGERITVVDGYIKDATVEDSAGNTAILINGAKGLYEFQKKPTYPIYSKGGILVDTNTKFDIDMSANSGNIISPINTIIGNDTSIKNNLLTTLSLPGEDDLIGDYIKNDNLEVAKLSQLCYAMLKDSKSSQIKFKTRLRSSTYTNLSSLITDVSNNDTNDHTIKNFLNTIKDYNGPTANIETNIKIEKNIIGGYNLNGKRANLDELITQYINAYTSNSNSNSTKELELKIKFANTKGITDFSNLFKDKTNFNVDISAWDTSSVINMKDMFKQATSFNQDISGWNTKDVTNMSNMFENATSFNQDISGWNISKVTNHLNFSLNSPIDGTYKVPNFPSSDL